MVVAATGPLREAPGNDLGRLDHNRLILPRVFNHRFDPAFHMHFLADVFDVGADGLVGNVEAFANLLVNVTRRQEFDDFLFTRR